MYFIKITSKILLDYVKLQLQFDILDGIRNVNKTLVVLDIKETFLHFVIDCPFPMFQALTYSMSFV